MTQPRNDAHPGPHRSRPAARLAVLAAAGIAAAGAPGTGTAAQAGEAVSYEAAGEAFEGYFAGPGEPAPLVLIVHDWDGLTDYERKRADMLAKLGYAAFAVDLYGAGVRPTELAAKRAQSGALYKDRERMRTLLAAGLAAARKQVGKATPAVAIGYCFGGAAVLEQARSGTDLEAFVSFHGGLASPEGQDYAATRGQILVFHGTADEAVSMDAFAALAKELEEHGVVHEMTTYAGAPHAFTVLGSDRYHAEADRRSWERFEAFLRMVLGDPH